MPRLLKAKSAHRTVQYTPFTIRLTTRSLFNWLMKLRLGYRARDCRDWKTLQLRMSPRLRLKAPVRDLFGRASMWLTTFRDCFKGSSEPANICKNSVALADRKRRRQRQRQRVRMRKRVAAQGRVLSRSPYRTYRSRKAKIALMSRKRPTGIPARRSRPDAVRAMRARPPRRR